MNKQAYRVVFNVRRGALMAVAENVSSQGKSTSESNGRGTAVLTASTARSGWMRLAQLGVTIALLFGGVTVVSAQIVADRNAASRPVVDQSANGKPVVQIVTPNAAGVSHNRYDQFNVGQGGAILNNASALTQTQQAGYISGNAALANGSARMILNEVTGASRSQLNGYIEVAGQRADVIVANPNGISCSGCGFINTSRGVLTTGTPEFTADGSLSNLRVTRGDISIDGNGMNASGIDRVDLIARLSSCHNACIKKVGFSQLLFRCWCVTFLSRITRFFIALFF
jgi:filamentous hemagglutinin